MKRALLASVVLAVSLVPIASAAPSDRGRYEQQRDHRSDRAVDASWDKHQRSSQRHYRDSRTQRYDARSHRYNPPRYHAPRYQSPYASYYQGPRGHYYTSWRPRYNAPRYMPPRGYVSRSWHVGHYLPPTYRGGHYVVDYRHYRLAPPPRGYHYIRVDDHVVLAAIASGLITEVLFDIFYR
jgi:Ni/Co efflux regulator RcnB